MEEDPQFWGSHPRTDHRPRWTAKNLGMLWECPRLKVRRCEECGHTELKRADGDWRFAKVFPRIEPVAPSRRDLHGG